MNTPHILARMHYFQFVAGDKLLRDVFTAQQLIFLSRIKTNSFHRTNSPYGSGYVTITMFPFGHRLKCAPLTSIYFYCHTNGMRVYLLFSTGSLARSFTPLNCIRFGSTNRGYAMAIFFSSCLIKNLNKSVCEM